MIQTRGEGGRSFCYEGRKEVLLLRREDEEELYY